MYHGVHVAGVEAVARDFGAVDFNIEVRLPEDPKHTQIGHAFDLFHLMQHLIREVLEHLQIRAQDLDGIRAFDAGQRLLDVVLDVLRKIEADAG